MSNRALEGLSVLEYCTGISGPYCAKLMADLGADVVKIEAPETGDEARRRPPFPGDEVDPEKSGLFFYLNTNKRSITLNPATPEGKDLFVKLAGAVDVLVVDKPPGFMDALGLGYDALKQINPGLIMTSITPFGLTGPYKDYKAYQLNTSHVSGQGYMLPIPAEDSTRAPVKMGGNSSDYDPGIVTAIAVMAAYFHKGITGKGQLIELSKQEALICMQRVESVTYPNDGVSMSRNQGEVGPNMPGGVMPCKDGFVVFVTPMEHQWKALMTLIGDPEWSKEAWCQDPSGRMQHVEEINRHLLDWLGDHTQEEIFRRGQALGCPVAPLQSAEKVINSEQLKETGFFQDIEHPELGKIKFPTAPYHFSKTPWKLARLAPHLGEHNEEVFIDRLGLEKAELAVLKKAGAI
ncbi:MAG: CoA transferase [Desulfobacterales bacterium]